MRPHYAVVFFALAGCSADFAVPSDVPIRCSTDADCTRGRQCLAQTSICVDPSSTCVEVSGGVLSAVTDGRSCVKDNGEAAVCYRGICRDQPCGNGVLDDGEACDGGETCSPDCSKIEVCGDLRTDFKETCDDGNSDPNDGCDACQLTAWRATVVLGDRRVGFATAPLVGPMVVDRQGHILVVGDFCQVFDVNPATGSASVIAGSGICRGTADAGTGDGSPARGYNISRPTALALDGDGNLYFAFPGLVMHLNRANGIQTRIVGLGTTCTSAADCPTERPLSQTPVGEVNGLAVAPDGTLYYSEANLHVVRQITPAREQQRIVVGTIGVSGTGSDAGTTNTPLRNPGSLACDASGNLYIADTFGYRIIRRESQTGILSRAAGTGVQATSADGSVARTSAVSAVNDLVVRRNGELVFREPFRIRRIASDGTLQSLIGNGLNFITVDGAAPDATGLDATGLGFLDSGELVFTNLEHGNGVGSELRLRVVRNNAVQTLTKYAVRNTVVSGQSATSTPLTTLCDFAFAANGDIYMLTRTEVLRLDASTGDVTIIGGAGTSTSDGAALADFRFVALKAIEVTSNGDLLLLTQHALLRVHDGIVAITGSLTTPGYAGDGGPVSNARFADPADIALGANDDIYIYDKGNMRIRRIREGTITTFAGNGDNCSGSFLPGGPQTNICNTTVASTDRIVYNSGFTPRLAVSGDDVFFTDPGQYVIRKIHAGTVSTVVGSGASCGPPTCQDGQAASATVSQELGGITAYGSGLAFVDTYVRASSTLTTSGTVTHVAIRKVGDGYSGDGDSARDARGLIPEEASAIRARGNALYFTDDGHLRKVENDIITTVAGAVDPLGDGPTALGELGHPHSMTSFADGQWLIADGATGRVRLFNEATQRLRTVVGYPFGPDDVLASRPLARYVIAPDEAFGVAVASGVAYITYGGASDIIRAVTLGGDPLSWTSTYLNETRFTGFQDGPIATARFTQPRALALDADARGLWITDGATHLIRCIELSGAMQVTTYGGEPLVHDFTGDGGPFELARFDAPSSLAVHPLDHSLYIADTGNNRVRRAIAVNGRVTTASIIETVLGNGVAADVGSGSPARDVPVDAPAGLAFDAQGNLLVTTAGSVRIVSAGTDGLPTATDAVQTIYGARRDTYPESSTRCLSGIGLRSGGASAYVLDSCQGMMIRLDRETGSR